MTGFLVLAFFGALAAAPIMTAIVVDDDNNPFTGMVARVRQRLNLLAL